LIDSGRKLLLGLGANDRAAKIFMQMHLELAGATYRQSSAHNELTDPENRTLRTSRRDRMPAKPMGQRHCQRQRDGQRNCWREFVQWLHSSASRSRSFLREGVGSNELNSCASSHTRNSRYYTGSGLFFTASSAVHRLRR